jgi:nucleoside-diphosphate-sugar epimerase
MAELIIGCGYTGRRVAAAYLERGSEVWGLVKTPGSATQLRELGIRPVLGDLDRLHLPELPLKGNRLFYFAPPPAQGTIDARVHNLRTAFEQQGDPRRVVYISTTGVYGDCNGEWVDESRPVNPNADRAKRRWDAEEALRAWWESSEGELIILRVSGIYGPNRLPLARLHEGLPLIREEEAPFTNRIHIDDLVCIAAMERGRDGEVYNVADGTPSTMTDYFNRIADLAGLARPPVISLKEGEEKLSAGMMSYMRESRRLDNRKLREELGVKLKHPTLDTGLPACFSG